jgi:hypothetical protein
MHGNCIGQVPGIGAGFAVAIVTGAMLEAHALGATGSETTGLRVDAVE